VGQRTLCLKALLSKCDGCGLYGSNPDGKKAGAFDFFQENYRLIRGHLNANADYLYLDQHG
jgi:hypothetical protein